MASILVIGSVSLDTLHIRNQSHAAPGGAGLYTALSTAFAGADATLLAPKPESMPGTLVPIAERIRWIGPQCEPEQLPRLEIAHHGDGKATLLGASWGATVALNPDNLPDDLSQYHFVHIAALPNTQHQLDFLRGCRYRKAKAISVGTYAKLVYGETEQVRALLAESDFFFMNENEAKGLFGTVEQVTAQVNQTIFVTLDRDGAIAIQADRHFKTEGTPVEEVDPTGAGDTFCGVTLAGLAQGLTLTDAAQRGCQQAALTVQGIGPAALLDAR